MEGLERSQKQRGVTPSSDPSLRYRQRSNATSSGMLFEDLGSSGFIVSPKKKPIKTYGSKGKGARGGSSQSRNTYGSSDDEMDLLSEQNSQVSDSEAIPKKGSEKIGSQGKAQPSVVVTYKNQSTVVGTTNRFAGLKFKKKSKTEGGEASAATSQESTPPVGSSSKAESLYDSLSMLSGRENAVSVAKASTNPYSSRLSSRPKKDDSKIAGSSRSTRQPQAFPMSPMKPRTPEKPMKGKGKARAVIESPSPSASPPPRDKAITRRERSARDNDSPPPRSRKAPPRERNNARRSSPPRTRTRPTIDLTDDSEDIEETPRPAAAATEPPQVQTFPSLEPLSSNQADSARPRTPPRLPEAFPLSPPANRSDDLDTGCKGKQKASVPFAFLSPLRTQEQGQELPKGKNKNKLSRFPMQSPLTSPARSSPRKYSLQSLKPTKSLSALGEDDADPDLVMTDAEDIGGRANLQPFPMPKSQLESIGRGGPTSSAGQSSKATRTDDAKSVADLEAAMSDLHNDSLFMDPTVDPSTLCPYCDEPLPPSPTPHLRSLLATAKSKSYREPRPGNPLGLKAPMRTFIAICQRHQFEAREMPKAKKRGWPTSIDFVQVKRRVEDSGSRLRGLVEGEGGYREESVFWNQVIKEMQALGSRAAVGVKGQLESFEKTQPGYYGEMGSMIIHQTLYNLFPPSSFDADSISPLTPTEFIQRVLVPEAALALIMEDMDQGRDHATQTMRESAAYGVAMFPEGGEGDGSGAGAGVGEDIVRERARARRKEVEVEDRVEEKMLKEARGKEKTGETKRRGKGKKRMLDEDESATETESVVSSKGNTKRKKTSTSEDGEEYTNRPASRATAPRAKAPASTRASATKPSRPTSRNTSPVTCREDEVTLVNKKLAKPLKESSDDEVVIVSPPTSSQTRSNKPRPRPVAKNVQARNDDNDDNDDDVEDTPRPKRTMPGSSTNASNNGSSPSAAGGNFYPLCAARSRQTVTDIPDQPVRKDGWFNRMGDPILDSSSDVEIQAQSPPGSTSRKRDSDGDGDSWLLSDDHSPAPS
ncbi:hypothetical protein EWM64_g369 [Hericium alpestre]|uniref:Restriction of telomere capping protein 4 n=1 Tax=Hericium alpestre TaxID=135208 RepID=A0A4Z0AAR1_9AGAM|nr:hypothetical protein EWM64_g369 [Hericium alpestre]